MSGRIVFFFKQKTAYEVRISDWSSDVCSSDLLAKGRAALVEQPFPADRVDPALQLGGIEPVLAKIMEAMGNARAVEPAPRLFHRIAVRDAIESQCHGAMIARACRQCECLRDRKSTRLNSSH